MKMAFESSVVAYISMFFLSIGVVLLQIVFIHNEALQIEEYAISMIEHHNRYDSDIAALINRRSNKCQACKTSIVPVWGNELLRYEVRVHYQIHVTPLKFRLNNILYSITATIS